MSSTLFGTLVGTVGSKGVGNSVQAMPFYHNRLAFRAGRTAWKGSSSTLVTTTSSTTTSSLSRALGPSVARQFWSWSGGDDKKWSYKAVNEDGSPQDIENSTLKINLHHAAHAISASNSQGFRTYMEDEFFVSEDGEFMAIFDGHGGNAVSRFLRRHLYSTAISLVPENPTIYDYDEAIGEALSKVDGLIQEKAHLNYQGSTALVIWVHRGTEPDGSEVEDGKPQPPSTPALIAANVGDSRAVLCRNGVAWHLTRDHKPNDPHERARIEESGGTIYWDGETDGLGEPILETGVYRINGVLALSRAIGDGAQRPHVTADPEVVAIPFQDDDQYIVMATDGLWDVLDSQEAVDYVETYLRGGIELDTIPTLLVEEALRRGTHDNITVVIVWVDRLFKEPPSQD